MHVAAQEQTVEETADHSKRRFPFERVAHGGDAVRKLECVNVPQPFERALNHFVVESPRTVEGGDPGDEALLEAKVAAFEGDQIAELEQARGSPRRDDSLGRKRGGLRMHTDISREIEAKLNGRAEFCFDDDASH